MHTLKNLSIKMRIQLIILFTIIAITLIVTIESIINIQNLTQKNIEKYRSEAYAGKENDIKNDVAIAMKILESFYQKTSKAETEKAVLYSLTEESNSLFHILNQEYKKNVKIMSKKELQKHLKAIVKSHRYGKNGYFWINNMNYKMIMHPIKPEFNGKVFINSSKVPFVELGVNALKNCKCNQAIIRYSFYTPSSKVYGKKISLVKLFKPYNWVIGTGAYVSDITKDIQKEAIKTISEIRFGKSGYFWIMDREPKMIMHPIDPSFDGKDLSFMKDTNGIYMFNEMEKVVKDNGSGIVKYLWAKPGFKKPQPKISFVKLFKPWGWIIGTGVYVNDIESKIAVMKKDALIQIHALIIKVIIIIFLTTIFLILITMFIAKKSIVQPIEKFKSKILILTKNRDIKERVDTDAPLEIKELGESFNTLMDDLEELILADEASEQEIKRLYEELKQKSQSALAKSEQRYKELATKDILTGILNRFAFENELDRLISNSKRTNAKFALLFLDLDHFKEVNDTYGHDIGDKLLQEVAQRVLPNIRVEDIFARLGGDEFILIFTNITQKNLHSLVEKAIELFRDPWIIDGIKLNVTTSMGVVVYPDDADNKIELLKKADLAMYKSKELGRNQVVYFENSLCKEVI